MARRRDLLAALGSVGAVGSLAGCTRAIADPVPTMTVTLDTPTVSEMGEAWVTTVRVETTVTSGVGEYPTVQVPRVVLHDADRALLGSVRLPVYESHDRQNRLTPPAETEPSTAATPAETEQATPATAPTATETDRQEPATPSYGQPGVPADTTAEVTTARPPMWVGVEFAAASRYVTVDLAKYTGDGRPSGGDGWTIGTHEYGDSAFRDPTA